MAKAKKQTEQAPITAYKGFDEKLQCRGFQFEVGKSYEHDGQVKACEGGFHACANPLDVWNYYGPCDMRFALVELSGEVSRHDEDSKIAAARITVKAELSLPQFIGDAVRFLMGLCKDAKDEGAQAASGDYSQLAASGDYSQLAASGYSSQLAASGDYSKLAASGYSSKLAASGDYSKLAASGYSSQLAASGYYSQLAASGDYSKLAASGYYSQLAASGYSSQLAASGYYSQLAASGDYSKLAASGYYSQLAASGDYSKLAASGDYSQLAASGKSSIAIAAATSCTAKVGELGCIVLTRWVEAEKRYRVSVGYVGEDGIKADTFYELDDDGKFIECA
jgi:hypothetical protein